MVGISTKQWILLRLISNLRWNSVRSRSWNRLISYWIFLVEDFWVCFSSNTKAESSTMRAVLIEVTLWLICCGSWCCTYIVIIYLKQYFWWGSLICLHIQGKELFCQMMKEYYKKQRHFYIHNYTTVWHILFNLQWFFVAIESGSSREREELFGGGLVSRSMTDLLASGSNDWHIEVC